jgi:hypothetical protein
MVDERAPTLLLRSSWLAEGETVGFCGFAYPSRSVIVRGANSSNSTGRHSAIISWPS